MSVPALALSAGPDAAAAAAASTLSLATCSDAAALSFAGASPEGTAAVASEAPAPVRAAWPSGRATAAGCPARGDVSEGVAPACAACRASTETGRGVSSEGATSARAKNDCMYGCTSCMHTRVCPAPLPVS